MYGRDPLAFTVDTLVIPCTPLRLIYAIPLIKDYPLAAK